MLGLYSETYGVATFVTACKKHLVLSNSKVLCDLYREIQVFLVTLNLGFKEHFSLVVKISYNEIVGRHGKFRCSWNSQQYLAEPNFRTCVIEVP